MVEITPKRIWIGVSVAWPLLWILIFDRWFFWTPIGLFITFGPPVAGLAVWWKLYQGDEKKMLADGRRALGKSREAMLELKDRMAKHKSLSRKR